ncbi:HNH endonuclease family protein [Kitasatospora sp. NPDC054939]
MSAIRPLHRALLAAFGILLLAATTLLTGAGDARAALPTPVPASTARTYLTTLTVAADSHADTYDRTLFPHWSTVAGTCNTRETVLKRDGSNVLTDAACASVSGSWFSVYDNVTTTNASSFDIDHMVPLAEAWRSGAWSWTTDKRKAFANDLTRPQLIAVSASSNRTKGDQDPAEWLPQASYRCTYARAWVQVKYHYGLAVDSAEKTALTSILNGC